MVIFTSNGSSCSKLIAQIPQLQGLKCFCDGEPEAEALVIGLNGKKMLGLDREVNGFDAIALGTPADYHKIQPDVKKVADAVRHKYPSIVMAGCECTEIGQYADTIEEAMGVVVYDPVKHADCMLQLAVEHRFKQLPAKERREEIVKIMRMGLLRKAVPHPAKAPKGASDEAKLAHQRKRRLSSFLSCDGHEDVKQWIMSNHWGLPRAKRSRK